ncbi:hypothetical protein PJI23_33565, partial [Mycobacterium kansasii]
VTSHNGKDIEVTSPNAPGVKAILEALNLTVRTDNGKNILVTQTGAEAVKAKIDEAARDRTVTINYRTGQISDPGGRGTIG